MPTWCASQQSRDTEGTCCKNWLGAQRPEKPPQATHRARTLKPNYTNQRKMLLWETVYGRYKPKLNLLVGFKCKDDNWLKGSKQIDNHTCLLQNRRRRLEWLLNGTRVTIVGQKSFYCQRICRCNKAIWILWPAISNSSWSLKQAIWKWCSYSRCFLA
jgi:hypothetical protein